MLAIKKLSQKYSINIVFQQGSSSMIYQTNYINQLDSMYPCEGHLITSEKAFSLPVYARYSSIYGYAFGDVELIIDGRVRKLETGQYFAFFVKDHCTITTSASVFVVVRLGYKVPDQMGWVEDQGRLTYIDGCSDSLLVYPSRMGDSSLNFLYFPPGITQSFHLHPSVRLGCVARGTGFSTYGSATARTEVPLEAGKMFCLEEQEMHRFRTAGSSMTVIAWHPDGDWGPTDHNHTMLNRTYLQQK